ncbi:hypothetical protein TRIUR3_07577 [Triticum urartu]|uniref:Uncharacterized protein n=1 Tax=Triticum urartu TaxID=4572 RepID=M7YIW7_TRIUA|nr:hypothetical protein TRIUR3_07577 [Triticum urartu]
MALRTCPLASPQSQARARLGPRGYCRRPVNGGTQTCLHAARGVAPSTARGAMKPDLPTVVLSDASSAVWNDQTHFLVWVSRSVIFATHIPHKRCRTPMYCLCGRRGEGSSAKSADRVGAGALRPPHPAIGRREAVVRDLDIFARVPVVLDYATSTYYAWKTYFSLVFREYHLIDHVDGSVDSGLMFADDDWLVIDATINRRCMDRAQASIRAGHAVRVAQRAGGHGRDGHAATRGEPLSLPCPPLPIIPNRARRNSNPEPSPPPPLPLPSRIHTCGGGESGKRKLETAPSMASEGEHAAAAAGAQKGEELQAPSGWTKKATESPEDEKPAKRGRPSSSKKGKKGKQEDAEDAEAESGDHADAEEAKGTEVEMKDAEEAKVTDLDLEMKEADNAQEEKKEEEAGSLVGEKKEADTVAPEEKKEADTVAPEEKKEADTVAPEEKKEADTVAPEEKKEADTVAQEEKKEADTVAQEEKKDAPVVDAPEKTEEVEGEAAESEVAPVEAEMPDPVLENKENEKPAEFEEVPVEFEMSDLVSENKENEKPAESEEVPVEFEMSAPVLEEHMEDEKAAEYEVAPVEGEKTENGLAVESTVPPPASSEEKKVEADSSINPATPPPAEVKADAPAAEAAKATENPADNAVPEEQSAANVDNNGQIHPGVSTHRGKITNEIQSRRAARIAVRLPPNSPEPEEKEEQQLEEGEQLPEPMKVAVSEEDEPEQPAPRVNVVEVETEAEFAVVQATEMAELQVILKSIQNVAYVEAN